MKAVMLGEAYLKIPKNIHFRHTKAVSLFMAIRKSDHLPSIPLALADKKHKLQKDRSI